MKHIERRDDQIILHLEPGEPAMLRSLPSRLQVLLRTGNPATGALKRIFPAEAGDEDEHSRELHHLMIEELRQQRLRRIEAFDQLLARAPEGGGTLALSPDAAEQWLALLTDMRLLLADQIGIENDQWKETIEPDKPMRRETALYLYLSGLQSSLLEFGFGISQHDCI